MLAAADVTEQSYACGAGYARARDITNICRNSIRLRGAFQ
jgi:hypothetical protein